MTRREFVLAAVAAREASISRALERELPESTEYLLASRGRTLAMRWTAPGRPAPLGSLVKPFVALAYGEAHDFAYPALECGAGTCWLPSGHGVLSIREAIAQSCNTYFKEIARGTPLEFIEQVAVRYGLPPPRATSPDALIGRYGLWAAPPSAIAAAYGELSSRRSESGVDTVFGGMLLCARKGTAAGARARIAAKTGTAPCCHPAPAPGDGLFVALFPAQDPEYVLILRAHGMPGAEAARRSAAFFQAVRQ